MIIANMIGIGVNPPGGQQIPVTVPEGFGFTPPFNIYKTGNQYTSDFSTSDYDFSSTTDFTYYFSESGLNSNDGLTPETPKLHMQNVISALNAAPPANGATFILVSDYLNAVNLPNSIANFPLVLKGYNGIKRRLAARDPSAVYNLTTNNTYSWVKATAPVAFFVIDLTDLDLNGVPKRMTLLASQADVENSSTGGVYYRDAAANTVYFKLHDLRAPDADVKAYVNDGMPSFTQKKVYVENIIFDQHLAASINPTALNSPATVCFSGVEFMHSSSNGLTATAGPTDTVILHNSGAYQNAQDGMDYGKRGADATGSNIVEIDCVANNNGYGSGVSENGSTTHDATKIIRINGTYLRNKNRNIHDVNAGAQSWLIGCIAKDAQNQSLPVNSIDFIFGTNGVSADVKAWLDGCSTSGSTSLVNLSVELGATVKYRNMDIEGMTVANSGTLEAY